MAAFNKIIIVGHLGRDPELTYTPQGTGMCKLSVATTEKRKDKQGESQDVTTWFRVTVWGKQAELCQQYLTKGRQVYLEGRLRAEEYTDREGNKRQSLEVNASDVQFIGAKGDDSGESRAASAAAVEAQRPAQGKTQKPQYAPMDDSDPVPF